MSVDGAMPLIPVPEPECKGYWLPDPCELDWNDDGSE